MANRLLKLKNKTKNLVNVENSIFEKETKNEVIRLTSRDNKNMREAEKNMFSILPEAVLTSLWFQPLNERTAKDLSVCKIVDRNNKRSDISNNTGTVKDLNFGSIDKNYICNTCKRNYIDCQGHYGHIELDFNIIHPFFREILVKLLSCICKDCSALLINPDHLQKLGLDKLEGLERLNKIAELCKKKKRCGMPVCREQTQKIIDNLIKKNDLELAEKYKKRLECKGEENFIYKTTEAGSVENIYMTVRNGKNEEIIITPDYIKKILQNMLQTDVEILGFKDINVTSFISNFIPVIPVSARPHDIRDDKIKDDYLTIAYESIFDYLEILDSETSDRTKYEKDILFVFSHMIDNTDKTYKLSQTDFCKSIKERIHQKTGLIRNNMSGKRVNYSARTVIGPNETLRFGQVAPPSKMKSVLTVPCRITKYNKDYIEKLKKENKIRHYKSNDSNDFFIYSPDFHNLEIGDTITRYCEDGDVVMFNRQPTLHKQSMLGYVCKFQENKLSMGLHLSSTAGHNADFDGDEANIHMLQTTKSQIEALFLAYSSNCIISSNSSRPIASLVMNSCTGAYVLSKVEELENRIFKEGMGVINKTMDDLKNLKSRNKYDINERSGNFLCSFLFPEDFFYQNKSITIINGIITKGELKSDSIGSSHNSIIQSLYKWYGSKRCGEFITESSFLFNWYIKLYGISVSLQDCFQFKEITTVKPKLIKKTNDDVLFLQKVNKNIKDDDLMATVEDARNGILDIFKKKFNDSSGNTMQKMYKSGGKGKIEDISKIINMLGQQQVHNNRPQKNMTQGKRWLSTFSTEDNSIFSRGFCSNSFFDGLNPDELFAHAQSSRIGIVDTSINTAEVGFLQRKMTKALEDLYTNYDGTIRNQNGVIYQFHYGMGMNSSNMVFSNNYYGEKTLNFINLPEAINKINQKYGIIIDLENTIKLELKDFILEEDIEEDIEENDMNLRIEDDLNFEMPDMD